MKNKKSSVFFNVKLEGEGKDKKNKNKMLSDRQYLLSGKAIDLPFLYYLSNCGNYFCLDMQTYINEYKYKQKKEKKLLMRKKYINKNKKILNRLVENACDKAQKSSSVKKLKNNKLTLNNKLNINTNIRDREKEVIRRCATIKAIKAPKSLTISTEKKYLTNPLYESNSFGRQLNTQKERYINRFQLSNGVNKELENKNKNRRYSIVDNNTNQFDGKGKRSKSRNQTYNLNKCLSATTRNLLEYANNEFLKKDLFYTTMKKNNFPIISKYNL